MLSFTMRRFPASVPQVRSSWNRFGLIRNQFGFKSRGIHTGPKTPAPPSWILIALLTGVSSFGAFYGHQQKSVKHAVEHHAPSEKDLEKLELETAVELPPLPAANQSPFTPSKTTVIFVLGGPGAGKGTQCEKLVNEFGFVHLSAGDLLRAERNRPESQYGQLINHYIKEGLIVPMEITINLLERAMVESGAQRFLIDGFPRKMDQALAFEKQVVESTFVLYFECPEEVMLERLLKRGETSGRVDDNLESIRKRFTTFRDTSFPVIEHYEKLGKVRQVSCLNSPDTVYGQVATIFHQLFKAPDQVTASA